MRILIATGIFIPEVGGPATYIPKIAKEFLANGHKVAVLTYCDTGEYSGDKDLGYKVIRIKRGNKLANYFNYYKALKKIAKDYDAIYAFDHFSAGLPAALITRKFKKQLYIRVGGDFIWERYLDRTENLVTMRQFYYNKLYKQEKLRFKIIKWVFKQAKGIIFTTSFQRDVFKKYYCLASDKLSIISNPVDIVAEKSLRTEVNKEIIFAGRFINKNNIRNLIKAFQEIKNKSFSLILIGEGPLRSELKELIKGHSNISIEPKLSREALKQRITNAYLLIFPSLTDISPNMMLECLSLNVPFVSSVEIGFNWIKDDIRLFDPLNVNDITKEINRLLDKEEYNGYSQEITNIKYNYTYQQAARDTINIFKDTSVLMISIDKTLAGGPKLGDALERHQKYGESVKYLDIIVHTTNSDGLGEYRIADNVVGHGSNSLDKLFFFWDALRIFKKIKKQRKINLVVCQDPFLTGLVGWWLKKRHGIKLLVHFHGDFWQNPLWLKERSLNSIFLRISKFVVPKADGIRVMSRGQKEKLIKAGIDENKIKVMATPIDIDRFAKNEKVLQTKKDKMILMVGRKDKVKDFDTLFKAMKIVFDKNKDAGLWLVGNYTENDKIPLDKDRVVLAGRVNTEDLPSYYKSSYLTVLSSTSESFGKVLVEANACAKPVMSTNTTGAKEIIKDGYNGYLVPIKDYQALADKILELLNNPSKAKEMGANGLALVKEKFSDNNSKIIDFWYEIINN